MCSWINFFISRLFQLLLCWVFIFSCFSSSSVSLIFVRRTNRVRASCTHTYTRSRQHILYAYTHLLLYYWVIFSFLLCVWHMYVCDVERREKSDFLLGKLKIYFKQERKSQKYVFKIKIKSKFLMKMQLKSWINSSIVNFYVQINE